MNTEDFNIQEFNEFRLITPTRVTAVSNSAWTKDNLWLRSRMETLDEKIVSQGFGKFFNLGMGPESLKIELSDVESAIRNNDAVASIKEDGSLLIRSVYDSRLILRTRGSLGYEHLENGYEINSIFKLKYPDVFDIDLFGHLSILFEWVTPNNVIVLRYKEPELRLVGAVNHETMTYVKFQELEKISSVLGVPIVKYFTLDINGYQEMLKELETNKYIEGYVIRIHDEQTLVKIKCSSYLTKHRLKSNLTSDVLIDLWFQYNQPQYQEFLKIFSEIYDEEICMWALPVISSLFDGINEFKKIYNHMLHKINETKSLSRKDFAILMQSQYGHTKKFGLIMNLWSGKIGEVNRELIKHIVLQNTKQIEMSMFSTINNLENENS